MKKLNINNEVYIQITDLGWQYLADSVGEDYINTCIKTKSREKELDGEIWYEFSLWECFDLMPVYHGSELYFKTTIMIDEKFLK